jgi:hypothetical protein
MKWWLYNRFRYLDSKYETGTSKEKYIKIRARAKGNVTLTAYVNMYGHVFYNAERVEHRMERGKEYEFVWAASGAEDAVIGIYDGDMITSLGDLAPLIAEEVNVSVATHLTDLKIGDASDDYKNYSLKSVTLGNNTLLRTLDLRNCPNLTDGPDVSGCVNIEEIYCEGTSITGIALPKGGILKTLHLPGTVNELTVVNQPQLTDFSIPSYSQISTLRLENAGVLDNTALDILNQMPANSRVRIIGFDLEMTNTELDAFVARLDSMRGLDENGNNTDIAQVSGTIHVPSLTSEELYKIQIRYPSITVTYDELILYTVRFWNGNTLLHTVENVSYNSSVEYPYGDPLKDGETDHSRWTFTGWSPDPSAVTGDMDCYAQFQFIGSFTRELVQRTIEGPYENHRVTSVGVAAFKGSNKLVSVVMPLCTELSDDAFSGCGSLKETTFSVDLAKIGANTFYNCDALTEFIYPNVYIYSYSTFQVSQNLKKADIAGFVGATETFNGTPLETLIIRSDTMQTIGNVNVLKDTHIAKGIGYIYVPRALVDTYKAATNWSTYAAQFRAIEDYPDICGGE